MQLDSWLMKSDSTEALGSLWVLEQDSVGPPSGNDTQVILGQGGTNRRPETQEAFLHLWLMPWSCP